MTQDEADFSKDGEEVCVVLCNDLRNHNLGEYIGIGCIDFEVLFQAEGIQATDGWQTPTSAYLNCRNNEDIKFATTLKRLWQQSTIALTFTAVTPEITRFRLYMQPFNEYYNGTYLSNIMRLDMMYLLKSANIQPTAWKGQDRVLPQFIPQQEKISLISLFNNLPSPSTKRNVGNVYFDDILDDIFSGDLDLSSSLYEYQKRSVAMMLQRELAPELLLDPRLTALISPNGRKYYVDYGESVLLKVPRYFEDVRGGILAEEMGAGKTLMCLALIVSTKHIAAELPKEADYRWRAHNDNDGLPSLADFCTMTVFSKGIPWQHDNTIWPVKSHLQELRLSKYNSYQVEKPRSVSRRIQNQQQKDDVYLSSGTIVVVPPNLVNQWEDEIAKHCNPGALRYLRLVDKDVIPEYTKLLEYDMILMARNRFDKEVKEGTDAKGRRKSDGIPLICTCSYIGATRTRDCRCPKEDDFYQSPLMRVHWKRLIIDEGHSMASTKTSTAEIAGKLRVQSRWIMTGTPSSGLYASNQDNNQEQTSRQLELSDLKNICNIVVHYLGLPPYSTDRSCKWPDLDLGLSTVNTVLQRVMIRHRVEHVEQEIRLPPMKHEIIRIVPSYFDIMSINLFLGAIMVNAVTSEREDEDYLFHPKNRKEVSVLVNNLREGSFYWTGWSKDDVSTRVADAQNYLSSGKVISCNDQELLRTAISTCEAALGSICWHAFSKFHEMGFSVENMSDKDNVAWALDAQAQTLSSSNAALLGGGHILAMQKYIASKAYSAEFDLDAFRLEGQKHKGRLTDSSMRTKLTLTEWNKRKQAETRAKTTPRSPQTQKPQKRQLSQPSILKVSRASNDDYLPRQSVLREVYITGTASSKLSYLLNKVLNLYLTEKILIFFENDNIGYYLAEALGILGIEYLLYERTLDVHRKAEYLVTFNTTETFRVFLMDVNQASHGINLYSASRVFFVNPLWKPPSVEAQAVKRAHRIGQTKPVYVETLVLADTIEEFMYKRKIEMSDADFHGKLITDDKKLQDILLNTPYLPFPESHHQFALLDEAQVMFGDNRVGEFADGTDRIVKLNAVQKNLSRMRFGTPEDLLPDGTHPVASSSEPSIGVSRKRSVVALEEYHEQWRTVKKTKKKQARFVLPDDD